MKTHIIDKTQIDESGQYCGSVDLSDWQGNIKIAADLGAVTFQTLKASGCIHAGDGTTIGSVCGITAGWWIWAGGSVTAGEDINTGEDIWAGGSVTAGGSINAGKGI